MRQKAYYINVIIIKYIYTFAHTELSRGRGQHVRHHLKARAFLTTKIF